MNSLGTDIALVVYDSSDRTKDTQFLYFSLAIELRRYIPSELLRPPKVQPKIQYTNLEGNQQQFALSRHIIKSYE